jgi:ectoine hydroxylase-related dioxygenase (phytanoyl-CoA dioxygenase family)
MSTTTADPSATAAPATTASVETRLRVHGVAILADALPRALVADLAQALAPIIRSARAADAGFRQQRLLLSLPDAAAVAIPAVLARPAVLAPLRALLGAGLRLGGLGIDVNLPGSAHQPSHMDCPYLFPEHDLTLPPFSYVLNIPLVDVDEENGPLELWPGTHLNQRDVDQDALIGQLPSLRPRLSAGSLLLRDIRLWHRGTPNRSRLPRPQIGIAYCRPWYCRSEVRVPDACYRALAPADQALVGRAD